MYLFKRHCLSESYAFATKKGTPEHMSLIEQAVAILRNCLDEGFPPVPVVAEVGSTPPS
jgi:hypothetical protein